MKKGISLILAFVMIISILDGCRRPNNNAEIITDATEEKVMTPAMEYLKNEILPQYSTQEDEVTTTYYCQTYGGMSGDFYSYTTRGNYYDTNSAKEWVLAYNVTDYNSDGIDDLFVISLDAQGEGEIKNFVINKRLYTFDSEGNAQYIGFYPGSADATNEKRVFAFSGDKIIEINTYDYSSHSEGERESRVDYPITTDYRWHTSYVTVYGLNITQEGQPFNNKDTIMTFSFSAYPSGVVAWDLNYEHDYYSEEDAYLALQSALAECGISGIGMSFGSTWSNRWEKSIYLTEDIKGSVFGFEISATNSERCYDIEQLEETYDGDRMLNTTTGEATFRRYEYEKRPVAETLPVQAETIPPITETEPVVQKQGWYNLEEAQEMTGLFILYPDGSFDRYYSGSVLTWEDSYMTYGTDYFPEDLVISINRVEYNKELLNRGQLVLFWPYENRVRQGLYAIEESGYSLFRTDNDGKLEGLILTRSSSTGTTLTQWNQNKVFYWSNSVNYTTINGVLKEKYDGFPSAEGRDFASFPANQTYTIGVVEGTTLVEKEYVTDHMYLLHADESSQYTLTPTTGGYAIFDFSDTKPGEYVFTTSYWNEDSRSRKVVSTYIVIE